MTPKESLKIFFTTSVAAFSVAEQVAKATGGKQDERFTKMQELHREALQILETSENWEKELVGLTVQMEILANTPPAPKKQFPKGGIEFKQQDQSPFISDKEEFFTDTISFKDNPLKGKP